MPKCLSNSVVRGRRRRAQNGQKCPFCGRAMAAPHSIEWEIDPGLEATVEHIITRAEGGTNEQSNLTFSCARCNNLRGNLPYDCFMVFSQIVLKSNPNAPTILLRNSLRQFISTLIEGAKENKKLLRSAATTALLRLGEETKKYVK